ncbi:uncharacterized protein LOC128862500 [Anastrepha ludens]|uniref:uncharacterized protein LOC128862500 n=1 Tax=Anastrepha ludens TaxID=28586 RepID=UPI0023AF054A|nr:uncharacterized protein LOC128862500 [Anastrepha ludens]
MGCASSTPMIATAGSDMLKAATHVASDAAKGAENAVEEVADSVGKTLDSAKETVGTAVTGIAHDLSNVFTEKSGELDTAKKQLLEHLHLGGAAETLEHTSETTGNQLDTKALEAAARAPTPPPDLDSLKTSTPEPEIERAMANSHEDTPPTPKPTIAELEKLTAEVKQTSQTTAAAAATATAVAEGIGEAKHAPAEASAAATEPAVDMVAWLAAEKRPGTTEWEKHADNLSKKHRVNEFKGGGKFRRFGPPMPPLNYIKPTENMKRALLEDDSCNSDAYYTSHSSPTNSDSPKLRRARLPINGVLATNVRRMQREFATFVSNRRSKASALRSLTVSPTFGGRFDYNSQRTRIISPTPSLMGYYRSGYSSPVVVNPELLNSRTLKMKIGLASPPLTSPPSNTGRTSSVTALSKSPLANNVITQPKLKSTKAFAPLRGETVGHSRIFGQTRTGSPVNRRVFAKKSGVLPHVEKARGLYARSGSPLRTRTLIQGKVEAATKAKPATQKAATIKLEREASVKKRKESITEGVPANGFSLSKALSPIKMAAEMHSLPHSKSEEQKSATIAHSLLEVVEQAVDLNAREKEVAKIASEKHVRDDITLKESKKVETMNDEGENEKKEYNESKKSNKLQKSPHKEHLKGNQSIKKSNKRAVGTSGTKKITENNDANSNTGSSHSKKGTPSPGRNSKNRDETLSSQKDVWPVATSNTQASNENNILTSSVSSSHSSTQTLSLRRNSKNLDETLTSKYEFNKKSSVWAGGTRNENSTAYSSASSDRSKKQTSSSKRNPKVLKSAESKETGDSKKHTTNEEGVSQKIISPRSITSLNKTRNLAIEGRFSMSPTKRETPNYANNSGQHNHWTHSSQENTEQSRKNSPMNINIRQDNSKNLENLSPIPKQKHNLKNEHYKDEVQSMRNNSTLQNDTKAKQKSNSNNRSHSSLSQNNWISSSRRNSKVELSNVGNRSENHEDISTIKRKSPSPRKHNKSSTYLVKDITAATMKNDENKLDVGKTKKLNTHINCGKNHSSNNTGDNNGPHVNSEYGNETTSKAGNNILSSGTISDSKQERLNHAGQGKVNRNISDDIKMIQCQNQEQNVTEHKLQRSTNSANNQADNDNERNNHVINGQGESNANNLTHQQIVTPTNKSTKTTDQTNSPSHNSLNSSPSKSSKSSTSIVIGTNLSTPVTEDNCEEPLSDQLSAALAQLEQFNESIDENIFSRNSCSVEEKSQADLYESSCTDPENRSRTDWEDTMNTDMNTSSLSIGDTYSSTSSVEDLLNALSPQTAYLNLGRSTTMMTLRSTTPIFSASCSFRSTPRGSPNRRSHKNYSTCSGYQMDKVPFVDEFSSVARSRLPQLPVSPYKVRARCAVCYNKYVIK